MANLKKHIVIFSTNYLPNIGGVEKVVYEQVQYLLAQGHQVTLVTSRAGARYGKVVNGRLTHLRTYLGLPSLGVSTTLAFPLLAPRTLWQLARLPKPDLIHLQFCDNAAPYAHFLQRRHHVPLMVSFHGTDVTHLPQKHAILAHIQTHVLEYANAITACSQALLEQVNYKPTVPAHAIPNGVHATPFIQADPYPYQHPYLLTVARLVQKKGIDTVLQAFAQLPSNDHHLLIAGDGPLRTEYEALAQQFNIHERVHFLGNMPPHQIPSLLAGAELFILGSRDEPFGIVLLEAMAAGKAVVATQVGGVPEFVEDGVNGRLIPPDNFTQMAQAIQTLLNDPMQRALLAQNGQNLVTEQYTWQKQGETFWQLYEQLWS